MTARRLAKAAEAIRETVSTTILFHLRDPRVKNVTVLAAEAAPDLKSAKVYVSVMGTAKQQSLCMHGLESARGFIQSKLADRLQTKNTPILKFVLDSGVKRSAELSQLLGLTDVTSDMPDQPVPLEGNEASQLEDDDEFDDDEFDDDEYEDDEDDEPKGAGQS
jgi:ribosome-binding factor A